MQSDRFWSPKCRYFCLGYTDIYIVLHTRKMKPIYWFFYFMARPLELQADRQQLYSIYIYCICLTGMFNSMVYFLFPSFNLNCSNFKIKQAMESTPRLTPSLMGMSPETVVAALIRILSSQRSFMKPGLIIRMFHSKLVMLYQYFPKIKINYVL